MVMVLMVMVIVMVMVTGLRLFTPMSSSSWDELVGHVSFREGELAG